MTRFCARLRGKARDVCARQTTVTFCAWAIKSSLQGVHRGRKKAPGSLSALTCLCKQNEIHVCCRKKDMCMCVRSTQHALTCLCKQNEIHVGWPHICVCMREASFGSYRFWPLLLQPLSCRKDMPTQQLLSAWSYTTQLFSARTDTCEWRERRDTHVCPRSSS